MPKLLYMMSLFTLLISMGFVGLYLAVGPSLPEVDSIRKIRLQTPMRVFSQEGDLIAEFGDTRRIPITLDQVPPEFINALLATEDQRFYEHSGVDLLGVLRAFINLAATGTKSQGASTITMLVARNYYLSRAKRFSRKITEMFLAWKLESELSKNEILELFLNKIHFSHRAYGLGAAAQVYYGTTLNNLSLAQLATLAGIPKGESIYNPISNPTNAMRRRSHVLGRMLAENHINNEQYNQAMAEPIETQKHSTQISVNAPYLAEMVRLFAIETFGQDVAYNDGLTLYTSIKGNLQKYAQQGLVQGLESYDKRHGYRGSEHQYTLNTDTTAEQIQSWLDDIKVIANLIPAIVISVNDEQAEVQLKSGEQAILTLDDVKWARKYVDENHRERGSIKTVSQVLQPGDLIRLSAHSIKSENGTGEQAETIERTTYKLSQIPDVSGGFVSLDPNTGAIEALVGDYDYTLSQFNNITQARRQPGSNIKPFVYAAAFQKQFTAASLLNDMPIVESDITAENIWRPKNDGNNYLGPTTLRTALRRSRNTVSVRLIREIGAEYTKSYLTHLGFPADNMPPYLSLALGTASFTPLEVAQGYAVLANGGFKIEPWFVSRVEDASGKIIFQHQPVTACLACEEQNLKNESNAQNAPSIGSINHTNPNEGINEQTALGENNKQNSDLIYNLPHSPVEKAFQAPRVMEPRIHYIITDILKDVIHKGTATPTLRRTKSPLLKRYDLAGKTGTTNGPKDAWFTGFNRHHVASAWVGFKDHVRELGSREYGGQSALPIWQYFMEKTLNGVAQSQFKQPEGIETVRIDPKSGKLATELTKNPIFEKFRTENSPIEYADKQLQDPYANDEEVTDDESLF